MAQNKEIFKHPLLILLITGCVTMLTTGVTMIFSLYSDVRLLQQQTSVLPDIVAKIQLVDQVDTKVRILEENIKNMNLELKGVVLAQADLKADMRAVIKNQEVTLTLLQSLGDSAYHS